MYLHFPFLLVILVKRLYNAKGILFSGSVFMAKFNVTHYEITSDKLSGLKREHNILFLTDLHNYTYGPQNKNLLKAIEQQHPDLILIGGDMFVGKPGCSMKVAQDLIQQLPNLCPVYYANGNHEQRMKNYPEIYGEHIFTYQNKLKDSGVQFLENEHVDCQLDECSVQIHGLEVPIKYYKKFWKLSLPLDEMITSLSKPDKNKFQILLAHNPSYVKTYIEWGADLILCGHFHGGVVRLPGIGGVITPQFHLFPKYSGEHTIEGNSSVVVSKGLGTHTIPIRIFNPAELVVLHLKPKKS